MFWILNLESTLIPNCWIFQLQKASASRLLTTTGKLHGIETSSSNDLYFDLSIQNLGPCTLRSWTNLQPSSLHHLWSLYPPDSTNSKGRVRVSEKLIGICQSGRLSEIRGRTLENIFILVNSPERPVSWHYWRHIINHYQYQSVIFCLNSACTNGDNSTELAFLLIFYILQINLYLRIIHHLII